MEGGECALQCWDDRGSDYSRAVHAEDTIAEARAIHEEVSSRMTEISRRAELKTSSAMGKLTGQVEEVTAHIQAQTSHATVKLSST